MDRGMGYGQCHLRNHAGFLGVFHRKLQIPVVVKSAERTGDVSALGFLDLEHEFPHICGNRIHPECVKSSFKHVCLDAGLVERSRPPAHGHIRILSEQEVHLLEGTSIGLDTVETSHVDNGRSHFFQLVNPRDIFARRLPHIPVNQGEFYFSCHKSI